MTLPGTRIYLPGLLALVATIAGLVVPFEVGAQGKAAFGSPAAGGVSVQPAAVPGCPNRTGIFNSISVPVGQPLRLVVLIFQPAPPGGARFRLSSDNASIVAAGDASQAFLPEVFIPQGGTTSNVFTVFGIRVGATILRGIPLTSGFSGFSTPIGAWDVNPGGTSKFVDAGGLNRHCRRSNTSPDVATDGNTLATCGLAVQGVASDATSVLLLRSTSGLAGTACYEITSQTTLDRGNIGTAQTPTQLVGALNHGFSFYRSPAAFGGTANTRTVEIEFSFTPNIGNGNTTRTRARVSILRPPVTLIHGIWSGSGTWRNFFAPNDAFHTSFAADYSATWDASFSTNSSRVKESVARAIAEMRAKGYAVTRSDVIAHSMGGLLTRLYIGSSQFRRPDNFDSGDINKLVTLNTPHNGTNFANLLVALHRSNAAETEAAVEDVVDANAGVTNGAVCDMAENSTALLGLTAGSAGRSQVITSTGGPAGSPTAPADYWPGLGRIGLNSFEAALTKTRCVERNSLFVCTRREAVFPQNVVDAFRFREANDAIVPVSSQRGGLSGTNFPNLIHFGADKFGVQVVDGVTFSQDVADRVFQLLDGPLSGLAASFPGALSNGTGGPRPPVPGRGNGLDQQDFANQCQAGGPLKPAGSLALASQQQSLAANVDPRLRIISPIAGAEFSPGDAITIVVQIDSPLVANDITVRVPGLTLLEGTGYDGSTYQATLTVPSEYAGVLTFIPVITDLSNTRISGAAVSVAIRPPTPPLSIAATQRHYQITATVSEAERLSITGFYADNIQRDITSGQAGTTYRSSDTTVVTVDSEGFFDIGGNGTATVIVENSGVQDLVTFVVETPDAPTPPEDLTAKLTISSAGLRLDRASGLFVGSVSVTNSTPLPIIGPLFLILRGVPVGISVIGAASTDTVTPTGSPYFRIPLANDGLTLQPDGSVVIPVQLLNPQRLRVTYTPKVFRTTGAP